MKEPLILTSDHPIIQTLNFRPFRSNALRRFRQFLPAADEPQTIELKTSWGGMLTTHPGDYIVGEQDRPHEDGWPVEKGIFEQTYEIFWPGVCVKRAVTLLVPLVDVTGDPEQEVTIISLEGPATVKAGDFYLAKGIKGEIWAYPKEKADSTLVSAG